MQDDHDAILERERLAALFGLADAIINAGFDVFPAAVWEKADGTIGKAPLTRHGHLEAHHDKQRIRQELIDPPHRPLDVPDEHEVVLAFIPGSGNCIVLDCDVKHGKQGQQAINDLVARHGKFYKAAWATPSGGRNILADVPADGTYSNTSPWPGIDVRGTNGWVVAPGNVTSIGAWQWVIGGFDTRGALPDAMVTTLTPSSNGSAPPATHRETIEFIEASPETSSYDAQAAFGRELTRLRSSAIGSRHEALKRIVGWCCGMEHLDLRWALEQIKTEWRQLTAGEGREDEVTDLMRWTVPRELLKRQNSAPSAPIDGYQDSENDTLPRPIDWHEFVQRDSAVRGWLVEGFWPWGRAMALYAVAKMGKSELALWCAAQLALGVHPWTGKPVDPIDIIYLDYEMGEDDLEERLDAFDIDPELLTHLHYFPFPALHALNDPKGRGGEQVVALVERHQAKAVIIDTLGRSLIGEENKADTVQDFYRHTGIRLKNLGIAYLRLDHAGKDESRQQRGSSAKRDDVDVVWRQRRIPHSDEVVLDCTSMSRLSWVGPKLTVNRVVDPATGTVSYTVAGPMIATVPHGVPAKIAELDRIGVDLDAGRPAARAALKAAGIKPGKNEVIAAALKARKQRGTRPDVASDELSPSAGDSSADSAGGQPSGTARGQHLGNDLFSPSEQGKHEGDS